MNETYCEVCGRRRSWGCGHTEEQEAAAREHAKTEEHLSGACLHFDHSECNPALCKNHGVETPGYAAFVKHADGKAGEP